MLEERLTKQWFTKTQLQSQPCKIQVWIFVHKNKFHVKSRMWIDNRYTGYDVQSSSLLEAMQKSEKRINQRLNQQSIQPQHVLQTAA